MKKRVISAAIVIAIFIPLFLIGGIPFGAAVGIVAAMGLKEALDLKDKKYPQLIMIIGMVCITWYNNTSSINSSYL